MSTSPRSHRMIGQVVAALAVLPVVVSCAARPAPSSEIAPAPASSTPATSATATSEAPTGSAAFTFDLPSGWREDTYDGNVPYGMQVERTVAGSTVAGLPTTVNVVSLAATPGATLEDVADEFMATLRANGQTIEPEPEPAGDFDGVPGLRYTASQESVPPDQVTIQSQVVLIRGDHSYVMTLSGDQEDPDLDSALDEIQETWRWTSS